MSSGTVIQRVIAPEDARIVRVALVDDHLSIIQGWNALLNLEPDLQVVALFTDGTRLVDQFADVQADVVLMDIHMPGLNGLTTARWLQQHYPTTQIVILTQSTDAAAIADAFAAGVRGYVLNTSGIEYIVRAIHQVMAGEPAIDPAVQHIMMQQYQLPAVPAPLSPLPATLSERELHIIRLIAANLTNNQIGDRLGLSERQIKRLITGIYEKLTLTSRVQVAQYALQHGLTPATGTH